MLPVHCHLQVRPWELTSLSAIRAHRAVHAPGLHSQDAPRGYAGEAVEIEDEPEAL